MQIDKELSLIENSTETKCQMLKLRSLTFLCFIMHQMFSSDDGHGDGSLCCSKTCIHCLVLMWPSQMCPLCHRCWLLNCVKSPNPLQLYNEKCYPLPTLASALLLKDWDALFIDNHDPDLLLTNLNVGGTFFISITQVFQSFLKHVACNKFK